MSVRNLELCTVAVAGSITLRRITLNDKGVGSMPHIGLSRPQGSAGVSLRKYRSILRTIGGSRDTVGSNLNEFPGNAERSVSNCRLYGGGAHRAAVAADNAPNPSAAG